MKPREYQKAITKVFGDFNIPEFTFTETKKHPCVVFNHQGREHRLNYCKTPSDHRSALNDLAFIKRYLRKINEQHTIH